MTDLHVPGYDVGDLLGYGATGEVWAARDRVTHAAVALKRVRVTGDEARDRLLREAAVLARVQHPHVVRLLDVLAVDESVVLVLEHAAGGSLRRLLAARGRLAPGEVVTLLVPLAQALDAVHAQGVVHGDVTPGNVLLSADGRPMLADLGVCQLLGVPPGTVEGTEGYVDPAVAGGATPGPASDVHGLAATCWAALTGEPPYDAVGVRCHPWPVDPAAAPLLALLGQALVPDPAGRPAPGELSAAAFGVVGAVPLERPGLPLDVRVTPDGEAATYRVHRPEPASPDPPQRRHGRRRRAGRGRRAAMAALVVAGVLLGCLTLLSALPRGPGQVQPVAGPRRAAASDRVAVPVWATVLRRLDARRAAAFARADPAGLEAVYATASPALERDRSRLGVLIARGLRAEGVRLRATSVVPQSRSPARVVLRVVDVLAPFRLRSLDTGQVVPRRGRGARAWRVTLRRDDGHWQVYDVVAG